MNLTKKIVILSILLVLIMFITYLLFKQNNKKTNKKKTIFTFLSAPGTGKGYLAMHSVQNLGFIVLSTGDLFRQHIADKTPISIELKKYMDLGQLVPDDLTILMVKEWLLKHKEFERSIILDGFPRTAMQAKKLIDLISKDMPNHRLRVIKLEMPQKDIIKRLVNRRVCSNKNCQAVYNTCMPEIISGKCPKCGTDLVQRSDDTLDVINQRFEIYNANESELINVYKSTGTNIEILNVFKKTSEEVFENFKKTL